MVKKETMICKGALWISTFRYRNGAKKSRRHFMLTDMIAYKGKLSGSEVRRREGISLAERCVIEHRRDGRYFDEILKGVEL